jgi:hypothetical protein
MEFLKHEWKLLEFILLILLMKMVLVTTVVPREIGVKLKFCHVKILSGNYIKIANWSNLIMGVVFEVRR